MHFDELLVVVCWRSLLKKRLSPHFLIETEIKGYFNKKICKQMKVHNFWLNESAQVSLFFDLFNYCIHQQNPFFAHSSWYPSVLMQCRVNILTLPSRPRCCTAFCLAKLRQENYSDQASGQWWEKFLAVVAASLTRVDLKLLHWACLSEHHTDTSHCEFW